MDNWEILGIEPTTDSKLIKRAYAKKLKITRPDEEPEAFQALYASYKRALSYAKSQNLVADKVTANKQAIEQTETQSAKPSDGDADGSGKVKLQATASENQPLPKSKSGASTQSEIVSTHSESDDTDKLAQQAEHAKNTKSEAEKLAHAKFEADYQVLARRCEDTMKNEKLRNNIKAWGFLSHSPMLLDSQVNTQLGLLVFEHIYQVQAQYKKLGKHERKYAGPNSMMQRNTLLFLNNIFSWHTQGNFLRYYAGEEACQVVIPKIIEAMKHQPNTHSFPKVKGGTGFTYQKPVDMGAKQDARTFAHLNLLSLNNWATSILCGLLLIFGLISLSEGLVYQFMISFAIMTVLCLQWWGLKQEKLSAYYTMWGFSVLLLLWFPVGTIYGFRMLSALYKSSGYIK